MAAGSPPPLGTHSLTLFPLSCSLPPPPPVPRPVPPRPPARSLTHSHFHTRALSRGQRRPSGTRWFDVNRPRLSVLFFSSAVVSVLLSSAATTNRKGVGKNTFTKKRKPPLFSRRQSVSQKGCVTVVVRCVCVCVCFLFLPFPSVLPPWSCE